VLHAVLWQIEAYASMAIRSMLLTAGGWCSSFLFLMHWDACRRKPPTS